MKIPEICLNVLKLSISGNIIPQNWFKYIRRGKTQRPDLVAMWILSDILYWYKPVEIKDEVTNEIIGYKKKFKEDKLQKSYDSYSKLLGIPKKTIKEHFKLLRDLNLISIEFRNIELESGLKLANVMYVEPNIKEVESITFRDIPIHQKEKEGISEKGIHPTAKKGNTNTENTTENTNTATKYNKEREGSTLLKRVLAKINIQSLMKNLEIDENFLIELLYYREQIGKPLKTERAISGLLNDLLNCKLKTKKSVEEIFEIMEIQGWKTIKAEWVKRLEDEDKAKNKNDYDLEDLEKFGYKPSKIITTEVIENG